MSVSVYRSEPVVSDDALSVGILHLKNAFQDKANDLVCTEIIRLAKKYEMGERQFLDSIDEYIMRHHYNNVTVADILDYDIRIKFYTGEEVRKICGSYGEENDKERFPRYGKIGGRVYSVSASEVANLPAVQREQVMQKIKEYKNN